MTWWSLVLHGVMMVEVYAHLATNSEVSSPQIFGCPSGEMNCFQLLCSSIFQCTHSFWTESIIMTCAPCYDLMFWAIHVCRIKSVKGASTPHIRGNHDSILQLVVVPVWLTDTVGNLNESLDYWWLNCIYKKDCTKTSIKQMYYIMGIVMYSCLTKVTGHHVTVSQ